MPVCVLVDVYPRAVRRARSPVAVGEIIVVVLTDLIEKYSTNQQVNTVNSPWEYVGAHRSIAYRHTDMQRNSTHSGMDRHETNRYSERLRRSIHTYVCKFDYDRNRNTGWSGRTKQ
jgi:hypothetical protein